MGYGTTYQIKYAVSSNNSEDNGKIIVCNIYDTTTFAPFAEEYIFDMGYSVGNKLNYPETPVTITTIDNSKDKLKIIRGKQATIQFFTRSNLDVSIFSKGSDDRFLVEIYIQETGNKLFKGFLVADDHEQEFQTNPTIATLTATDNLALLKEIPLVDFAGLNPHRIENGNKFKLIELLAFALSKTNLNFNINVCCSFFEISTPNQCAFDTTWIDARTMEKNIGTSIDCYSTIEYILKPFCCYLTQYKGMWWIQNIDEMEFAFGGSFTFNPSGILMSTQPPQMLRQDIGNGQDSFWINEDARINFVRPYKYVQYTYTYEFPKEIIPNINFASGNIINGVVLDPGMVAYTLQDWQIGVYLSSSTPPIDAVMILRKFENNYEKERWLRFKEPDGRVYSAQSNPIFIDFKDKFTISVDTRLSADVGGHSGSPRFRREGVMQVRLYGTDGTFYFLHGPTSLAEIPKWVQTNAGFSINTDFIYIEDDISDDETQWLGASCDAPPAPVSGNIVVWLINWGPNVDFSAATDFQNLRFDYSPYINGSYAKYSGQYRKVSQSGNYSGKIDDSINLSDSPKQLFKGTMFKKIAGQFVLTDKWYSGAVFPSGVPSDEFLHPLGTLQVYSIWNQYRNGHSYFTGTVSGLNVGDSTVVTQGITGNTPDLIQKYFLQDTSIYTLNKLFMCVETNQDFDNNKMTITVMETFDVTSPKVYNDPEEFKYIDS